MKEKDLQTQFGLQVRSQRKLRDLTQEDLAERAGLSAEYISHIERGLASPSFRTVAALSDALKVDPGTLFNFSGERRK